MYYDKTCNKRKYLRRTAWGKKRATKKSVCEYTHLQHKTAHLSYEEWALKYECV